MRGHREMTKTAFARKSREILKYRGKKVKYQKRNKCQLLFDWRLNRRFQGHANQ